MEIISSRRMIPILIWIDRELRFRHEGSTPWPLVGEPPLNRLDATGNHPVRIPPRGILKQFPFEKIEEQKENHAEQKQDGQGITRQIECIEIMQVHGAESSSKYVLQLYHGK